jgi:hypothetical protein
VNTISFEITNILPQSFAQLFATAQGRGDQILAQFEKQVKN